MLHNLNVGDLDKFILSLAEIDSSVTEMNTQTKMVFKDSVLTNFSCQIEIAGEDRYYIMDGNLKLLFSHTVSKLVNNHPSLDEVIVNFQNELIRKSRDDLHRNRVKGNANRNLRNHGERRLENGKIRMGSAQRRR